MSIIVNGKEYPDERSVPEQYRMQTQMGTRQRDPGNFSPDLAPNVGRSVLPHVTTFSGMMSTLARTYRQHDEAIRHNKHNANMMRRDPMIMGPLFARQMAVALLQWQVQPEDSSDDKQVQIAKELTFMVSRIPRFREYLRNLMEAVWYGRYGIQNVWGFTRDSRGVRYRTVVDWVPVNGDKLLFRYDDGTGRYDHDEIGIKVSVAHIKDDIWAGKPDIEWNSEGTGVFLRRWERSRLVVHKNFMMDGDYEDPTTAGMIHGVGLRHFLYWSWYQKQETLAQLAEVVERAGMGFTVYTYPAGNAQAREEVERLAEEQAHKNQIVLPMEVSNPDAYSIQQIPPNTQGIMALQSLIDDYFGSWIIKFILGQTLSYRAEAGTPGISDLHRDSFLQIVKYDSLGVEETVTKDLIRMLLMFNFPSYQNVNFQFKLNTEEAVPLEKLQALQAAWSMGAKIKSEDVMGLIGLNVAGATDQALYNPQVLASLKEYEMMEEQQEKEEQGGQGMQITESQDEALAAMLGPVMQSKKAEGYAKKSESGNYKPTKGMIGNAKRGLELRKKHEKGGTAVGVARARDIINGKGLSFSTVKRMHSFFSRHAGNEEGGEDDAGYIAWLLWGGDSGRNWARSIVEAERKNAVPELLFDEKLQEEAGLKKDDASVIDTPEEDLTEPAPQRRGGDSLLGAIASGAMEGATRGAARRLTGQQGFQFAKDEDDDGLRQGGLFGDVPVKDDYIPKKKEPKAPSNEKQKRLWSEDDLHNLQHDLEQRQMFKKKSGPDRYDEDDQADFESQYKDPERHPEGGWNTPEWQDWKPEGAKVYENFIPRETHVVNKDTLELKDLKYALNKSIDWMKLSPSKDDFVGQIDQQVKKGKEILGEGNWPKKNSDVKKEDIDKLLDAGVSIFSDEGIDWHKDAAGKEWDRHSRRLIENPERIKQLEEQLKEFGDLVPKTGEPIVVAGYHGTTSGRLESFDPEKRGSYTGAGSAALGDFHAGSETTSQAYMDMPKFPFRGYVQLKDEQKKDFANELEDHYRYDVFNQVSEMSDDEIREIWGLDEDDEVDDYRSEDNYQSMHNLNEVMDYDDWLNEKLDFNPEFFRDIGNNILDAYGEEDKEFSIDKIKPYIHKNYIKFENPYVHDYKGERYREESYHDIIKAAKKAGHDGVLLMNTYDGGSKDHVIVSFSPDQIKDHDNSKPTSDPKLDYDKEPERNAMGAGPRDHSPEDFDVTGKQINGQATANRGTMPKQATQSSMPSKADKGSVSTNPVSKTGMSSDATRMDRGASLANMRDKFMKYRKTKLIEMLQPFVQEDPDFSLTDAQGKKRRTSLFKADKYSLANTLASKYAEGEDPYARTKPLDRHIDGVIESYVGEGMSAEDKKDLSDSLYNTWRDVHSEHQADVSDFNKNLNSLAQQFGYERAEGTFTRKARSAEDVDAMKRLDESQQDLVRNTISSAGKLGLKVSGGDDIEKVHSALMHGHQKPLGKTHDDIWKEVIQRERLDEFSREQNEEEEVPPITGEEAESLLEGQRAATEQQLEEFIEGQGAEKPTPSASESDEPYGLKPTADPEVPTIRVEGELPVTVEESPLTKIAQSASESENVRSFMRGIGKNLRDVSVEHKRQWLEANDIEPKNIQSEKTLNSMIRKFIREKAESKPEEELTQQEMTLQPTPEPVKPIQPTQAQLDMVQDLIKSEETPDKLQGFINELKSAAESGDAKSLSDILEERDEFALDRTMVADPERLESLNIWIDSIEQASKTGDMDAARSLASGEEPVSMEALDEEKERQIAQGQQEREKRAAQEKQEATFQENRQQYWDQVGEEEGMKRILDFIMSDQAPDELEGFINKLKEAADSGSANDLLSVLDEWEQTEEDVIDPGVKQEDIPLERKNDLNDWIGSIEGLVRSGDLEAARSFARGEKPIELPKLIKGISKETGLVEGELTDAEKLEQLKQDQEERIIQRRVKARMAFEEQQAKERNQTLKDLKKMALDQKAKAAMFESKTPMTAAGGRVSESTIDEYHASALPHLDSSTVVKIAVAGEDRGAIRFSSDGTGSFVMEHEKPNGDKIYYDAKQAKKALGKSFNKIAGQAILRDNKAWAGKALMAGLVTPDAASKLTRPASQTYMTTQMKAKINEAAITAMANLGTSNGGINLGDYSNTKEAADAAFDKMRGHMNDIQKPGGWLDTLKGAGFAYNDKASVADNYVNGMQYVMEKAGQTGFRASKQKNAVENMQDAIQHLSKQSEDEKGWSPWAVAGGIGILAVLLLFYSVMKD